jgi:glycosyltransferase involved in cell wall biosynthesis
MLTTKDISLIQPSRNNLKYLKWSYESIRKNGGKNVNICVADDYSTDGTWEWCKKIMGQDPNFLAIRNEGPTRLGHTILYDRLINEVARTPIVGIYHADMYLCPGALESVLKHIKPLSVVSLTRIEPPLHPDGPEKVLVDYGIEPDEFKEEELLKCFNKDLKYFSPLDRKRGQIPNKVTEGIFAPWFLFKEDFQSIGGHDPLYAPQSKEDSDIFNRFQLNGYKFIQTWDGFVYHMTCRGSRFNPTITKVGKESDEWLRQNKKSSREFIRKWGHFVKHDRLMKPIVPPKWDIGLVVNNCNLKLLEVIEPWCNNLYCDEVFSVGRVSDYVEMENTSFDLYDRIKTLDGEKVNDIIVEFDANRLTQYSFQLLMEFSTILQESEIEVGEFELDIFKFRVNRVKTYEMDLIKLGD